jgi:hypothetical protein
MNSCTQSSFCRLSMPQPLEILVRADVSAPPLAREPVRAADLSDAVAEAWRDQCLRRGYPDQTLADMPVALRPTFSRGDGGARCSGFELELELPDGARRRQQFSLKCLRPVATRAAAALVSAGILHDEQRYFYELAVATEPAPPPPAGAAPAFSLKASSPPPAGLRVPLRPLLRAAQAVDLLDEEAFPVFFTAAAMAKAEACSRQGACSVPPVESGGVLVGSLASCEVTKEFFALVTDVLEVVEGEQKTFSLAYSGPSWRRIETIMKARQAAHPAQAVRLLGQCHGHNFLPSDGNRCDQCDKRPVCGLSSVFVSPDDQTWMRAVFARQPWALCLIFGLNARQEPIRQLYSLNDGRWQARGYFVLPDFDWQAATPDIPQTTETQLKKTI